MVYSTNTILSDLAEWSILGKTRMSTILELIPLFFHEHFPDNRIDIKIQFGVVSSAC